jgi:hypothetical protein
MISTGASPQLEQPVSTTIPIMVMTTTTTTTTMTTVTTTTAATAATATRTAAINNSHHLLHEHNHCFHGTYYASDS